MFSLHKLSHQIVFLCFALVLITTLAILSSFWWYSNQNTKSYIENAVNSAIHVFDQYSQTKAELLTTAAQVLTSDFGFKQAVASRDRATMKSALQNHGDRINADLMLIVDRSGGLLASNVSAETSQASLGRDWSDVVASIGITGYMAFNDALFQVITLPVKAPHTIAFAIVGFKIDDRVTQELKYLTGLEVSFYESNTLLVSSISENKKDVEAKLQYKKKEWGFLNQPRYANNERRLNSFAGQTNFVTLSNDLSHIYDNFNQLIVTTLGLAALVFILAFAASVLLTSTLTIPLARVVSMANRYAKGEYEASVSPIKASSEIQSLVSAFTDMGQQIRSREEKIIHQSRHDLLTNLLNRDSLLAQLKTVISEGKQFLLLAIHARDLQSINDKLGFETGDQCLQEIARRLKEFTFPSDAFHGRIDGDLFLSVVSCVEKKVTNDVLTSLVEFLENPIAVNAMQLNIRFNIGISQYSEDGSDAKSLIRRAQIALDAGRKDSVVLRFYQKGEDEAHLERLSIVEDLKTALIRNDGQLYMHYQPKQRLSNGKIEKLEALIRWQRPGSGFVPPDVFIDLAERTGLIIELTQWVLETVCKQINIWRDEGVEVQVAVNISAQDLIHKNFLSTLEHCIKEFRISPHLLTLELTERDLMKNERFAVEQMKHLNALGFLLSVDDYGIGQSSLSKLKALPVQELKIDKSFILKLDQSSTDQMIVRSTIELGHNLNLHVVAEGVENKASLELLRDMRCDSIQGYFLAKPMAAAEIRSWLETQKHRKAG